jgi:hypothetical protein
MLGDATLHLTVVRLRRGEIDPRRGLAFDQPLGVAALAGTGAAENESDVAAPVLRLGHRAVTRRV